MSPSWPVLSLVAGRPGDLSRFQLRRAELGDGERDQDPRRRPVHSPAQRRGLTSVSDIEYLYRRAMARTELLKGTLDLMILRTLELETRHGLGVAERLAQLTRGTFSVRPGSLFPALHRLEGEGLIRGEWTVNDQGRRI